MRRANAWVALHDVHWPGRPQANIDHIAVGPGGIVVIDAKNWTGDVAVKDGVLRQNGYSRARETTAAAKATSAVTSRLAPEHRTMTHAVLCLATHDADAVRVGNTTVVGRSSLAEHLVALPARLTAYDVADVARMLTDDLAGERSPAVLTSGDVEAAPRSPRNRPVRRRVQARKSRRRTRSRLASLLFKIAVILMIVVAAPRIITAFSEGVRTGVITVFTPPEPTVVPNVPEQVPVAPTP